MRRKMQVKTGHRHSEILMIKVLMSWPFNNDSAPQDLLGLEQSAVNRVLLL